MNNGTCNFSDAPGFNGTQNETGKS